MTRTAFALALVSCGGDADPPTDPATDSTPSDTDDETTTGTSDTGTPTDTGTAPGCASAITITYAEGGCLGYFDQWDFKVDNAGCAESARLAMWDTVALDWDEEHPMEIGSEGPDRIWQNWVLGSLPHATPRDQWQASVNTVFDCYTQPAAVTFAARLLGADGASVACAIWGHDPDAVLSGSASAVNSDLADFAGCEVRPF